MLVNVTFTIEYFFEIDLKKIRVLLEIFPSAFERNGASEVEK